MVLCCRLVSIDFEFDARCSPLFGRRELEECVVLGSTSRTYEQVGWGC